jgi:predicted DNA-binding helix-hairpin-helix protein
MGNVKSRRDEASERSFSGKRGKRFAPTGQSTQMIIGADQTTDAAILGHSTKLYGNYQLKRVYYSAFSPTPDATAKLPLIKPPLIRERRLYQADWLLRFYGSGVDEITAARPDGNLDLELIQSWLSHCKIASFSLSM